MRDQITTRTSSSSKNKAVLPIDRHYYNAELN